ncbi:MAG: hypothetical protein GVY10_07795 [Verrucomicrobia bacterium]|jgi:surface-anchored protein|nr:hypothetical protein [Verrucomicrobiota bacterium]
MLRGADTVVRTGHYDLGIDYVPGEGWTSYIWDFATRTRRPAHEIILHLGESTRETVPDDADFAFLGSAGESVWILPEIFDAERLYLGIGARQLGRNIFTGGLSNRGRVTMRLLSVEGTGPEQGGDMVMWQAAFPPRVHFSTADGIGPEDALEEITANFHAHYNFAFTEPGLYRARFAFSGTLLPERGGGETGTEAVYTFEVLHAGDAGPLRYAWDLGNGRKWSSWLGGYSAETERWIYADHLRWMYLPAGGPDSFWLYMPGRGWLWSGQSFFPWSWSPREGAWTYLKNPTNS